MTQFSIRWILSLNRLCQNRGQVHLDTLLRVQETWVERYCQVKSKQEGAGNWTLNLLDREGVLVNLFTHFREFQLLCSGQNRRIELVIAVDGELDRDLARLRNEGVGAEDSRTKLFALLCTNEVVSRDASLEPFTNHIRDYCKNNAHLLIENGTSSASEPGQVGRALVWLAPRILIPAMALGQIVLDSASNIVSLLDNFIASLSFDSRVGSLLEEAAFGRLIEAGDLSPVEARTALDRLKHSLQDESALPTPTSIDHSVLRQWLGVPQRARLQAKPTPDEDAISRRQLLGEVSGMLQRESFVLLHGLSKIGKSQFVAALIDHDDKGSNYFWYTFVGDASDLNRLTRQLAVWVGETTGKWQTMDDLENLVIQPGQAFERLGHAAIDGAYLVLDDCHKATDSLGIELLRRLISRDWPGSHLLLISERKLPAAVAIGAREVALSGLTPQESALFATKLGVDLADSLLQFGLLSIRVGGHPVMLKAAISELPHRPTPAEVLALVQRLPSIDLAQAFLNDLSNRIFFGLLKTQEQRLWLSRIAAVAFPVTQGLALWVAQTRPPLEVVAAD